MRVTPADSLRVVAVFGLFPATVLEGGIGFALMLLVLGGCMVPRGLGTPTALDALYCGVLIFAAWAALLDWYVTVGWLDLVVHAMATGLLGLMTWQLLHRVGVLVGGSGEVRAKIGALVGITATATLLAVLWEIVEWLGHTFLDPSIQVGYVDTVTDLLSGVVGALLAGLTTVTVTTPAAVAPEIQRTMRTVRTSR